VQKIVELGVKALITGHTGPKAFETMRAGDVEIYNLC
jgi:predicted Fe-Mo cluster-binding NifX family protein